MKLIYKITIPSFLGLILVVFLVAFLSKHFLERALLQEAFQRNYETTLKQIPKHLNAESFLKPFSPFAQTRFKRFLEELETASTARITIWNKDRVIVFSDLKSIIGSSSPGNEDLKRLFSEERPFFVEKTSDTNFPVQSKIGEFLDIYVPIRISGEIVGAAEFHAVAAAVLSPVKKQIEYTTVILSVSGASILVIVFILTKNLTAERDHNVQLYQKSKEQALELEKSNKVKDEFLAIISHELRTPLTAILGYAQLMRDRMLGELSHEQEDALERLINRSRDLLGMINSLLQATGIETAGLKKVTGSSIRLGDWLQQLRTEFVGLIDKALTLKWTQAPDLPEIRTDATKLKQILENLIANAIKFTEKGSVSVEAQFLPGTQTVEFKVTDTGIGIPEEALPMIFERFWQVDSSDQRSHGGVGMGLFIAKKFTEALGGKIEVRSEPRKGSTFTVSIPISS